MPCGSDFLLGKPYYSASATSGSKAPSPPREKESNMKTRVLMATVGGAAAALAAGVMWTAPSAAAVSDFCDSLGNPAQIHDCNCGVDNVPGSPEYQQCLHGAAAAPGPASTPPPAPPP
jgi:hypothetical protein